MAVAYSQNGTIVKGADMSSLPDLGFDKAVFKNFFPMKLASASYKMIDENLIYDGRSLNASNPIIIYPDFKPTISDDFEICLVFMKNSSTGGYSSSGRCLIGSYSDYYNNFTIETHTSYAWVGIPSGESSWTKYIHLDYPSNLVNDKWYGIRLRQKSSGSSAVLTYELFDGAGTIASKTASDYVIRQDLAQLQLGGTSRSSFIHWNGFIDLKRSFISVNGNIIWGCNMPLDGQST